MSLLVLLPAFISSFFMFSLTVRCRVNLALAYTELTEELGRVRCLTATQGERLRHISHEAGGFFSTSAVFLLRSMRSPVGH